MINISKDIYPIIEANVKLCINGIWARDTEWYEVSLGVNNITAYFHIVNGKIFDVQFD